MVAGHRITTARQPIATLRSLERFQLTTTARVAIIEMTPNAGTYRRLHHASPQAMVNFHTCREVAVS